MARILYGPLVQPIELLTTTVPPASDVMAIGWGLTGNVPEDNFTEQLQTLQMRPITNMQCMIAHDPLGIANVVTAEKICTVDRNETNSGGVW